MESPLFFTQRTENKALLRKYIFYNFVEQLLELVNCKKENYKLNLKGDSNNAIQLSLKMFCSKFFSDKRSHKNKYAFKKWYCPCSFMRF